MATYSFTSSFEMPDPKKMPFDIIIRFEGTGEGKKAAKAELKKACDLLKQGAPYPDGYENLEELENPKDILLTTVDRPFQDQGIPLDEMGEYLRRLIVSLHVAMAAHESITFRGAAYMPKSFMGNLRSIYFIGCEDEGKNKTLNIEQYMPPNVSDSKFDIEKEISDWYEGRNPRREENIAANREEEDDSEETIAASFNGAEAMDFPTFLLTLLSGDWVFFGDSDIIWDGEHHKITGIQLNGAQVEQLPAFINEHFIDFDGIEDVVNYLIGFMGEIEKDDGLRIPRSSIAPGVQAALRDGDLTGITFMNLAACAAALLVKQPEKNSYVVAYDTRLAAGIPAFFDLTARLLWDLRQGLNSLKSTPFKILFLAARNVDADQCLGDVRKPVIGAQENPQVMIVDSLPEVHFDGVGAAGDSEADDDNACYVPFSSGFDDPTETQADEELFETAVNALMREFPLVIPIEGTHVLGRAQRIEDVKVGDGLVLAADWQSPYFTPACIEVFNSKGETLGNLSETHTVFMSGHRELALLLPYVKATVESVTPLSKRRKNAKYALMDVRLELDTSLLPEKWSAAYEKHLKATGADQWPQSAPWLSVGSDFMRKMVLLLAKPKSQRVTMSQSRLGPKRLKGNIDASEAVSDPYSLKKSAKKMTPGKKTADKKTTTAKASAKKSSTRTAGDTTTPDKKKPAKKASEPKQRTEYQQMLQAMMSMLEFCDRQRSIDEIKTFFKKRPSMPLYQSITNEQIHGLVVELRSRGWLLIYGPEEEPEGYRRTNEGYEYLETQSVKWLFRHGFDTTNPPKKIQNQTGTERATWAARNGLFKLDVLGEEIDNPMAKALDIEDKLNALGDLPNLVATERKLAQLEKRTEKAKQDAAAVSTRLNGLSFIRIFTRTKLMDELEGLQRSIQEWSSELNEVQRQYEKDKLKVDQAKELQNEIKEIEGDNAEYLEANKNRFEWY